MEITPSIKYVGVDDLDIDLFESQYVVPEGMAYNSYIILDEKVAIMDTADARKRVEWWANVENVLGDRTPDYLVVQHIEPDHASLIAEVFEKYPQLKVVATAKAVQMMPQFFPATDFAERTIAVKEGDTLSLGSHTLQFFTAPMVHWPEVMVCYEQSEKVLFSADGFGKFGASLLLQYLRKIWCSGAGIAKEGCNARYRHYMSVAWPCAFRESRSLHRSLRHLEQV